MIDLAWEQLRAALLGLARSQRFALDEVKLQGAILAVAGPEVQALTPALAERACLQAGRGAQFAGPFARALAAFGVQFSAWMGVVDRGIGGR
jgi:hypothetical protein